jgi:hypothetical protein
MAGDLRAQFPEPSQLAEQEADQVYEWIVQHNAPESLPKSSSDIEPLLDYVTPMAMDRMRAWIQQSAGASTASSNAMLDAMQQSFRNRLLMLFIGYVKSTQGFLGGWIDALRTGQPTDGPRRAHPDAWALGEEVAEQFAEMVPDDFAKIRGNGRDEWLDFVDMSLDPTGPANMRWAASQLGDDTYEAFSLGFGSRMLTLLSGSG